MVWSSFIQQFYVRSKMFANITFSLNEEEVENTYTFLQYFLVFVYLKDIPILYMLSGNTCYMTWWWHTINTCWFCQMARGGEQIAKNIKQYIANKLPIHLYIHKYQTIYIHIFTINIWRNAIKYFIDQKSYTCTTCNF